MVAENMGIGEQNRESDVVKVSRELPEAVRARLADAAAALALEEEPDGTEEAIKSRTRVVFDKLKQLVAVVFY